MRPLAQILWGSLALQPQIDAMERSLALRARYDELQRLCEERQIAWQTATIRFSDIVAFVAHHRGVSSAEIISPTRLGDIVRARQEVMYLARQQTFSDGRHRYSFTMIGKLLGGRDHTTVLHGVRQHGKRLDEWREAA
jgi:chromosomal replication initiation ATPase DnaA